MLSLGGRFERTVPLWVLGIDPVFIMIEIKEIGEDTIRKLDLNPDSIVIETIWELDDFPDMEIFRKGWALHGEDPDDWTCWQSEVRATTIRKGKYVIGSAYLGGTWEKAGDHPSKSNPEISGYYPQMLEEALEELSKELGEV